MYTYTHPYVHMYVFIKRIWLELRSILSAFASSLHHSMWSSTKQIAPRIVSFILKVNICFLRLCILDSWEITPSWKLYSATVRSAVGLLLKGKLETIPGSSQEIHELSWCSRFTPVICKVPPDVYPPFIGKLSLLLDNGLMDFVLTESTRCVTWRVLSQDSGQSTGVNQHCEHWRGQWSCLSAR